jgi:hypothetical protein
MKIALRLIALITFISGMFHYAAAESGNAASFRFPKIYETIDIKITRDVEAKLLRGSPADKNLAIKQIISNPQLFAPPAFYALANAVAAEGDMDKALYWFYVGQLRANVDASISSDPSSKSGVVMLNSIISDNIRKHQFNIVNRLEELVLSVLDYDKNTAASYDRRWISIYGMKAARSARFNEAAPTELTIPELEWGVSSDKARRDWHNGFISALPMIRKIAEQQGMK